MPRPRPLTLTSVQPQAGDVLITEGSFPNPDAILHTYKNRTSLSVPALRHYLEFLECVVVQERIVVVQPTFDEKTLNVDQTHHLSGWIRLKGDLDLERQLWDVLKHRGIVGLTAVDADLSPRTLVDQYESARDKTRDEAREALALVGSVNANEMEDVISAQVAMSLGGPLSVAEFARRLALPFQLHDSEAEYIQLTEAFDRRVGQTVMRMLKSTLDSGAIQTITNVASLGNGVVFPATPIAYQILNRSITPEDLLDAALSLRDEYRVFRDRCMQADRELFDEHTSLRRRSELLADVQSLAKQLWSAEPCFNQRATSETVAFAASVGAALDHAATHTVVGLAAKAVTLPLNRLLSIFKRRRVRQFVRAREEFLAHVNSIATISRMFNFAQEAVRREIERDQRKHS